MTPRTITVPADPTATAPSSLAARPTEPEPVTSGLQPASPKRRLQGKIACLSKDHRDVINALLVDGATYATVIHRMAEQGVDLNPENVSNWYQTGFQEHLAHLQRADYQRARYEAATDLLKNTDPATLPQAGLQTAAAQIYDLLGYFTAKGVAQNVADDPEKYTRIINSLSRLARETLALQKYQDICARARAALQPIKDANRKLSPRETRAIVRQVDRILGVDSSDLDDLDQAQPPGPSTLDAGRAISPKAPPQTNPNPPSTN